MASVHCPVIKGLLHDLRYASFKFRKFVQKQDQGDYIKGYPNYWNSDLNANQEHLKELVANVTYHCSEQRL
jgi:hypothetical protein